MLINFRYNHDQNIFNLFFSPQLTGSLREHTLEIINSFGRNSSLESFERTLEYIQKEVRVQHSKQKHTAVNNKKKTKYERKKTASKITQSFFCKFLHSQVNLNPQIIKVFKYIFLFYFKASVCMQFQFNATNMIHVVPAQMDFTYLNEAIN